jgi:hypothetical protein
MQACPICRASLHGASVCRRCRAELGKVQEIEQRGHMLAVTAMRMLVEGDAGSAVGWLGRARFVHATPAVRTLDRLALVAGAADQTE